MIELAVIRHPASDPENRLGTLFFNPGGPGGQGTIDLPNWLSLFPAAIQARFDIVSWDPRGIGASTAVQCFPNANDEALFFSGIPVNYFPVGAAQEDAWISRFAVYGRVCEERNGALLAHVSTVDTANDMELLRQAVGSPQLNYLGVSYGTFLGAVYANLFPDRVRAMVLDGNVDPVAWTESGKDTSPLSTSLRLGSDQSAGQTLHAFLDLCGQAGTGKCSFSAGSADATEAKFATLLQRLQASPVTIDGTEITYAALLVGIQAYLFTTQPEPGDFKGWVYAGSVLQAVWAATETDASASAGASPTTSDAGATETAPAAPSGSEQKYTSGLQLYAVECAESPNPHEPALFLWLAAFSLARSGPIGPASSWSDEPCASWQATAAEQYVGPWDRTTANSILVIGNTYDPSTPYQGAVAMARDLAQARLLTVSGYGHTALLNPSDCVQQAETSYFFDGTLPAEGTICQQNAPPF